MEGGGAGGERGRGSERGGGGAVGMGGMCMTHVPMEGHFIHVVGGAWWVQWGERVRDIVRRGGRQGGDMEGGGKARGERGRGSKLDGGGG